MRGLRRWQDIREGFIVEEIVELKCEQLVRVKPVDGGTGE